MPQITLTRADAQNLYDFCVKHKRKTYFIAKDHGAYLGATGKDSNVLFYFRGCNPDKDPNWYDTCHAQFGGDDFGEQLDIEGLKEVLDNANVKRVVYKVSTREIQMFGIG